MERRKAAPSRPPNPALPYREDCWSEGETSALVDAWGDRFLELNRGNIRQKQWQEVAGAVNARPGGGRRPPRTDVQCKNRIDTLKKKYKIEKAKICDGAVTSKWPFYSRLDMLVGSSVPLKKPKPSPSPSPPLALPLPCFMRRCYSADGESESSMGRKRKREVGEGGGMREMALGIERLAEIYERVEGEKYRQMMELEKQRMEFVKGLEFQRMQMFVDTQVQVEKIKRTRRNDDGFGIRNRIFSDHRRDNVACNLRTDSRRICPDPVPFLLSTPSDLPDPVSPLDAQLHASTRRSSQSSQPRLQLFIARS